MAGSGGKLPVFSLVTLNRTRIAFWLVVAEYRLHIERTYGTGRRMRTSNSIGLAWAHQHRCNGSMILRQLMALQTASVQHGGGRSGFRYEHRVTPGHLWGRRHG